MLLKKQGLPEDDELVLCTVTKIHFHSVFVNLDEYNMSAMIHISEIAPGRIRNIRDFVVEGKVIVCKVLRVDRERGHVDLSLRRVNDSQKRLKLDVNGRAETVETDKASFTKSINSKAVEGNNYARLEPFEDVEVVELKVELA